jgi:hypothetical protein
MVQTHTRGWGASIQEDPVPSHQIPPDPGDIGPAQDSARQTYKFKLMAENFKL